ncbi:MAG TPA: serine hydrolase domain-containing protein [Steroidobacteraceae bacterium]|jgi:CubicO group peptidase (beta-lactamase class C family)|nr:serine hydrolase domain-containing protein [Steroidobacteraceae bacterium]
MIRHWLVAILLAGPCTCGTANAADAIDSKIEARMKEAGLVGVGAAIILDKRVVWAKGYGFADKQSAVRFTPDTVMNIGSISKTFTGVALMQAVEDGKLSLDADINTYLPFKVINPWFPDARITLRHLATHTSGITDRSEVYERLYHWGGDAPEALGDFLAGYFSQGGNDYSKENFVAFKPGTHREYSNIGAGLAGYIIERAVGEKLNVYTKRRVFMPLQMTHTGWLLSEVPRGSHSTLYIAQDGFNIPIPQYGLTTYPDGGVRTSVADLSRFFIALLSEGHYEGARILKSASAAEMLRFQYTAANKPDNVELREKNSGLFWSTKLDVTRIGHGGSDPGVMTEMLSNLDKDVAIVLFSNTSVPERDGKKYLALVSEVWNHAEALRSSTRSPVR